MTFNSQYNNIKEREVKCYSCGHEEKTTKPEPKCPNCGFSMVTKLASVLTEQIKHEVPQ